MPINERLNLSVLFGGSVKATASTTIVDTSIPAYEYILVPSNPSSTTITEIDVPTYTLTANKSSVNEGDSVVFTLTTTMLDTGTIVPYTISGVSVSDISLSSLTGNFTTDAAGKATLTLSLIEDVLTEGTETLTISINGQSASRSVTINDTSGQPYYNIGWYSDAAGNNAITQINEGSFAYAVMKTQYVPNGTVVNVTLSGTGITTDDFTNSNLNGSITINNGIGYLVWMPGTDRTTEGTEVVTITAKVGSNTVSSKILNIIDTSLTTTYAYNVYDASAGGNVVTDITNTAGPEIVINITSAYGGISTMDEGYYIKPTINLFELFVSTQGRKPLKNEKVTFNVASNVAIIGNNAFIPALIVSHLWDPTNVLKLNNNGIISGRGGDSIAWFGGYGGGGIDGGSAPITVTNSGTISGGGGAGGSIGGVPPDDLEVWVGSGGGGGAPYGKGRKVRVTGGQNTSGKDATLFKGGGGAHWPSTNAMSGGDMGKPGIDSTDVIERPGAAGKAYNGRVNITNIGAGKIMGS